MSQSLNRVIDLYARFLAIGGIALAAAVLLTDQRFINAPISSLALIASVTFLRAYPVRLSKYSYLTQVAVPVLVGALAVGPSSVVLAILVGVIGADTIWLRKSQRVAFINAGREIIAFTCAFGVYAAVMQASGSPGLSLDFLPAGFSLVAMYFLASRALFYFTLLVRDKLEQVEQLLILRWEVVSMLLTLGACVVVIAALQSLSPAGWVAVAGVLTAIGMLTKRILEEAIAAEDLNKIHLMESAITGNAGLHGSFEQIERLAYRLLDWGDYRVCRWNGAEVTLAYRGRIGRPNRERLIPELATFRREVVATARPVMIRDAGRDPRISAADPDVQSILIYPVRFGDDLLGTFEIDHFKRNAYGPEGPLGGEHDRGPGGDGDPHRRAAPSAGEHGGADQPAGRGTRARHRVAAHLGRGADPGLGRDPAHGGGAGCVRARRPRCDRGARARFAGDDGPGRGGGQDEP